MADEPEVTVTQAPLLGVKPWYESKTVWSGVATIVMAILPQIDTVWGTHLATSPFYATALVLLGAFGIHGRLTASNTIG